MNYIDFLLKTRKEIKKHEPRGFSEKIIIFNCDAKTIDSLRNLTCIGLSVGEKELGLFFILKYDDKITFRKIWDFYNFLTYNHFIRSSFHNYKKNNYFIVINNIFFDVQVEANNSETKEIEVNMHNEFMDTYHVKEPNSFKIFCLCSIILQNLYKKLLLNKEVNSEALAQTIINFSLFL